MQPGARQRAICSPHSSRRVAIATHRKWHATFVKKLLADAEKEYDLVARFGYGVDGDADMQSRDFEAVRGTFDTNSFVRQMKDRLDDYD